MSTRTRTDWVLWAQLGCALVATAYAEYGLAKAAGLHPVVAVAIPGALDLYVIRALQKHRDVLPAVTVMILANVAAALVSAGILPVTWAVYSAVGALAPALVWRGHTIRVSEAKVHPNAGVQASAPAPEVEVQVERDVPAPEVRPEVSAGEVSAPALEAPVTVPEPWVKAASAPGLSAGDMEYVALAQEYVGTTDAPSVRGLKAYASVGQARAERLLTYLGVRS